MLRTWLYVTPNEGVARKTLGHLSFMISSVVLGWRSCGRADVVVVSSPTFFSIGAAWLLARCKRARLVVEIRDLWPAIFAELGVLTQPAGDRAARAAGAGRLRGRGPVVVVTEGFRANLIGRGVPPGKVHTIRNGVVLDHFDPRHDPDPVIRARLGARRGDCLVLYVGTHGISQGLPRSCRSGRIAGGEPVHFAFVGDGADKTRLRSRVAELGLANVTLLPGVPHPTFRLCWRRPTSASRRCVRCLCSRPLSRPRSSNTLRPARLWCGSVAGEAAQILAEAGAMVVPPEDSAALAEAIRGLAADPRRRLEMGRRGRAHVERCFDRVALAREYRKILELAQDRG